MSKKQDPEQFRNVIDLLANVELTPSSSKDQIFNRVIYKMETGTLQPDYDEKDGISMKKNKWRAAVVIASAVICLSGAFSATSYAQEWFQSIIAHFQVGGMVITQYDKEIPSPAVNTSSSHQERNGEEVQLPPPLKLSLQEARSATGMNFPAPSWLSNYEYVNSVIHGDKMVEVTYKQGDKQVGLLISKGDVNGISTTGEVKTETINGTQIYFANGIVIWEHKGYRIELYSQDDFDTMTLGKIIDSLETGKPVTQAEIDTVKTKVQDAGPRATAAPVPAAQN
ncbi:hypothetical protein SAMN03159341_109246 [Paenibacillus sp. 1_12]|uniref:hypothetical protein n=1 Tax=Paenibacillus sp. 1_12 TaxID=1566278 RepID=UPI0008E4D0A5|nr:hypothetical protein [Paenibacillus sp. 1_12]SFL77587.1 hypothetical protein SAMN03159341_109246 [Paenibacillus sp. 1_12]